VLVETLYQLVNHDITRGYKAAGESLYPGDSKLVYTGPWLMPTGSFAVHEVYYMHLLRPLDQAVLTARAPARVLAAADLTTGTVPAPTSRAPAQAITAAALANLDPLAEGCGVEIVSAAIGAPGEVPQLVCLRLNDGQGVTLLDGMRLFRRAWKIEVWKGDQLLESTEGLVVRDDGGRHWLLEGKGYF
jgi:hypothetical protein